MSGEAGGEAQETMRGHLNASVQWPSVKPTSTIDGRHNANDDAETAP